MAEHELASHLGPRSPLGALYQADAMVLLLGVGFSVCTAFHLAEYRQPAPRERGYECVVLDDGKRVVRRFVGLDLCDSDFAALGAEFAARDGSVRTGMVGNATGQLMPLRRAVDFAVGWMGEHRRP
jgi:aminoglycoside 3-N-acetyltransferase